MFNTNLIKITIDDQQYEIKILEKEITLDVSFNPRMNFLAEDESEGVIVPKFEVTQKILEYLLMNDDELKQYSGLTSAECFRIQLIRSLVCLWD